MKKLLAILMAAALLCGAGCAEGAQRKSLRKSLPDIISLGTETDAPSEREAEMRAVLDAVLTGDPEVVAEVTMPELMEGEQVQQLLQMIVRFGEATDIRQTDAGITSEGAHRAVYVVQQGENRIEYTIDVFMGKLVGINMRSLSQGMGAIPDSVLDPDRDYEAEAEQVLRRVAAGEYGWFLQNTVPELFVGVTEDVIAGFMDFYGEPEMAALNSVRQVQGCMQFIYEVAHEKELCQWQLILDGEGRIAGFYIERKHKESSEFSAAAYRSWQKTARGHLDLLLSGDYEGFFEQATAMARTRMDENQLRETFDALGEMQSIEMYDLYEVAGGMVVEFHAGFGQQEMILRIALNEDGRVTGAGADEVIRLQ